MSKLDIKIKKSFTLLITIVLITLFSILSISILQTQTISTNINKIKFLQLRANIIMNDIVKYIQTHNKAQINSFIIVDKNFDINITNTIDNNKTIYNIEIKTKDETNIRLFKRIM